MASKVDYTQNSWSKIIQSDLIGTLASELNITRQNVSGLVSLLLGDL